MPTGDQATAGAIKAEAEQHPFRRITLPLPQAQACETQKSNLTIVADELQNIYVYPEGQDYFDLVFASSGTSYSTGDNKMVELGAGRIGLDATQRARFLGCIKAQVRDPVVLGAMNAWEKSNQTIVSGTAGTNYGTGTVDGAKYFYELQGNNIFIVSKKRERFYRGCGQVELPEREFKLDEYGQITFFTLVGRADFRGDLVGTDDLRLILDDVVQMPDFPRLGQAALGVFRRGVLSVGGFYPHQASYTLPSCKLGIASANRLERVVCTPTAQLR